MSTDTTAPAPALRLAGKVIAKDAIQLKDGKGLMNKLTIRLPNGKPATVLNKDQMTPPLDELAVFDCGVPRDGVFGSWNPEASKVYAERVAQAAAEQKAA